MAIRMPISRVRSVTDTSMIFIMPIPPTNKETDAIEPNTIDITLAAPVATSASAVKLRTVKSFSLPFAMR